MALRVAPGRQEDPIDLDMLVMEARILPDQTTLTCQGEGWCGGQPLLATVVPSNGEVLLVKVERLGHIRPLHQKVTTPLMEPEANGQDQWQGKEVQGAVCHRQYQDEEGEVRGHWVFYRKHRGIWYCLDSTRIVPHQENPFLVQSQELTIDILLFK